MPNEIPPKTNTIKDKPAGELPVDNSGAIKEDAKKKALDALKNKKVAIVDIEDLAQKEARDAADKYMTEDKASLKGVKGFFKKIWKHTYVDEFYRQREVGRIKNEIKKTGNIYTREGDMAAHQNAMHAVTDRFVSEYEGVVEKENGEEKEILDSKNPEAIKTKEEIKKLIYGYADGSIDELSFNNAKKRITESLEKQGLLKGAGNYADNLLEIAKDAKIAVEHGAKMEELDLDTNIILGKAKSSIKTEANFSYVDKAIDSMKKTKIGRFVSPPMVATALGIAYCVAITTSKKLASSRAAQILTFGGAAVAAGGFAFVNESQRVANERRQHSRDITKGQVFEEGDKRREQMEKYEYDMAKSTDLENNLRNLLFTTNQQGKEEVKNISEADLQTIISNLSSVEARRSLSNKKQIDLISYSNIANVEREKADLFILVNKSKAELKKKFGTGPIQGLQGKTIDEYLEDVTNSQEKVLLGGEKGIDAQDKDFRAYKYTRAGKKAAMAIIGGAIIGAGVQEGVALVSSHVQGVFEGLVGHHGNATIQTPLEHLRGWISGHPSHLGMENAHDQLIGNAHIKLPEGVNIVKNPDGTFNVMRGTDVISNHVPLKFNSMGGLDNESVSKLGEAGIMTNVHARIIDTTKDVTENAKDWINGHPKGTIPVSRDGWYGNDTPMYTDPATGKLMGADLNELKTQWGGPNGSGLIPNPAGGNDYVLNISHMTPDGSFQSGLSVDAQEAMKNGTLMAMISLTGDTQGHCIPVPIGADGNMIFDHNNPIMQELFKPDANGHPVYHGKFLEVVEKMGTDANGVEHVRPLGTLVGEGLDSIKDHVGGKMVVETNDLGIPLPTQPPYFVPILSRRPLERGTYKPIDKTPVKPTPEDKINVTPVIPVEDKDIDKDPTADKLTEKKTQEMREISQEEYDAMRDDMIMLNRKRQLQDGIATITEADFKSEYGKKRYNDLQHFSGEVFNHEELLVIGDEIENILRNAKVIKQENAQEKQEKIDVRSDLELLNKKIQASEGIVVLSEEDFKSEYGKKRFNDLKHIGEGIPVTFNKEELEMIATEMEGMLRGPRKIENLMSASKPVVDNATSNESGKGTIQEIKNDLEADRKKILTKEKEGTEATKVSSEEEPEIVKVPKTVIEDQPSGADLEAESLRPSAQKTPVNLEKIFTKGDLSKVGTEYESEKLSWKITKVTKGGWFGTPKIETLVTNKETGEVVTRPYNIKDVEEQLARNNIKITKAGN